MRSSSARAKAPKLLFLMTNPEPRHPEILRPSVEIKGLGEETLAFTSSSPEELRMRNATQKEELMSKPHANLEALPSRTHVSTRTKPNHLNCSRPSVTWLFQGLSPNKKSPNDKWEQGPKLLYRDVEL